MILTTEMKEYLEEQQEITGASYAVCDSEGRCVFSVGDVEIKESNVQNFLKSEKEERLQKGCFYKRFVQNEEQGVLVTTSEESASIYGKMIWSGMSHIGRAADPDSSVEGILRSLLVKAPEEGLLRKGIAKGLKAEAVRTVFLVRFAEEIPEEAGELLKNISPEAQKDLVTDLDQHTMVYIRCGRGAKEEKELAKFAEEAIAMLNMELFANVRISYGMSVNRLEELCQSYQAAFMAMEVAQIFYENRKVASYNRLGIGRLIYELPKELCTLFLKEIFGENRLCNLDEEEQSLIERFFANNLNISETARDLFMHRNTLTFRLEKLQKHTGLDIRKFEDAMTLKLGMMVARFLQERNPEA